MIGDLHESSKFNSQTAEASNDPGFRIKKAPQNKTNKAHANDTNANMPDYFRSNINRTVDKGGSEVLTNKIHNE